jgi:Protein of unknown function (DUF4242)
MDQSNGFKKENELTVEERHRLKGGDISTMAKFLDVHPLKGLEEETLRELQDSPIDEFGIKHLNIMYNQQEDRFYCLLDAPDKQAVEDHHDSSTHLSVLQEHLKKFGGTFLKCLTHIQDLLMPGHYQHTECIALSKNNVYSKSTKT